MVTEISGLKTYLFTLLTEKFLKRVLYIVAQPQFYLCSGSETLGIVTAFLVEACDHFNYELN
jgi:hypothetical protein